MNIFMIYTNLNNLKNFQLILDFWMQLHGLKEFGFSQT